MSGWVFDCSLAASIVLPDEDSALAIRFMEEIHDKQEIWVPILWINEIASVLVLAQHRKRLNQEAADAAIDFYLGLTLTFDQSPNGTALRDIMRLAVAYRITGYDAAYLELARRRGLGLASLDEALKAAARNAGVRLFD